MCKRYVHKRIKYETYGSSPKYAEFSAFSLVEAGVIYVIRELIGRFKSATRIARARDSPMVGKPGRV